MSADERIVVLASKQIGLRSLNAIDRAAHDAVVGVVTIDDRDDPRNEHAAIRERCLDIGVPLFVARNRAEAEAYLITNRPTLSFVIGWYWLIGQAALTAVRRGLIGLHFSDLPRYRGGSPLVWALINGERRIGASLFSLTSELDAGPIWSKIHINVPEGAYVGPVLQQLEDASEAMLDRVVPLIVQGSVQPSPQDSLGVSFGVPRLPSDGIIDWTKQAAEVLRFIRAQSHPYPGAYSWLEREKVVIWRAREETDVYYGPPGSVARIGNGQVSVVCGDSRAIGAEIIQRGEGDPAAADATIRSIRVRFRSTPSLE